MEHPQLNPPKACAAPSGSAATKVAQVGKERRAPGWWPQRQQKEKNDV